MDDSTPEPTSVDNLVLTVLPERPRDVVRYRVQECPRCSATFVSPSPAAVIDVAHIEVECRCGLILRYHARTRDLIDY